MSKILRKMIGWIGVTTMCVGMMGMPAQASTTSYYATNPSGYGAEGSITIDGSFSDWNGNMLIAQGVANDDARIFRGSHEGPVYDTYALYGAWDDENLYLMWQFVNVTDVVDPAQGYPISDNGKPWNGDIPQILALSIDPSKGGTGQCINGNSIDDNIWGIRVNYETPVDTLLYFSSKPGVGQPSIFKVNDEGYFDYSTAVSFKDAGISFKYGDGLHSSIKSVMGINANGYSGYTPNDLTGNTSLSWVNMLDKGHSTSQDTMYEMAIPLESLGISKDYLEKNGIGVMHISTFGQSGITSIPYDESMLNNATEPYSHDDSTSAEKEDTDIVTTSLADLGAKRNGGAVVTFPTVSISPATKNFKGSTLTLTLGASNATTATYTINDGEAVTYKDGQSVTISDIATGESVKITLKATNAEGTTTKEYTYTNIDEVGGEVPIVKEGELKVFAYKPDGWGSNMNVYVYKEDSTGVEQIVAWPGAKMTSEGDGLYSYELDTKWEGAQVIFNDGLNQSPMSEGLVLDCSRYYKDGEWNACEVIKDTSMKVSATADRTTYTETLAVTLNASGEGSATYSINGGEAITYTDGTVITIGEGVETGTETTLTLKGVSSKGEVTTQTYTYTKENREEDVVYFKKPSGWGSNINVYIYDERSGAVKTVAAWPGVTMDYIGNGYYSYTLPEGWDYANIIFNDGSKQVPATTGYVYNGTSMIYEEGTWDEFVEIPEVETKSITFDNSRTNWSTVNVYIYDESEGFVKEVAGWPGVRMTNKGGHLFTYEFSEDWSDAKVIFNNGSGVQIPGSGQTGYSLTGDMIYSNGIWSAQ